MCGGWGQDYRTSRVSRINTVVSGIVYSSLFMGEPFFQPPFRNPE